MKKIIKNFIGWFKKNRDEIFLILFVGLPTGIICILLSRCIDYSYLY